MKGGLLVCRLTIAQPTFNACLFLTPQTNYNKSLFGKSVWLPEMIVLCELNDMKATWYEKVTQQICIQSFYFYQIDPSYQIRRFSN